MKVGENMRIPEPVLTEDFYMVKRIGGDVALPTPRTRFEELLYIYAGGTIERPTPKTVEERFLDYITGGESELPVPKTRLQIYMYNVANPSNKIPVVPPKTRFECYWFVMAGENKVISDKLPVEFTSVDGFLLDYTIWGNSEQDGTPSPENPVEVVSVGDRTVNLFDFSSYYFNDSDTVHNFNPTDLVNLLAANKGRTFYYNCKTTGVHSPIVGTIRIYYNRWSNSFTITPNTFFECPTEGFPNASALYIYGDANGASFDEAVLAISDIPVPYEPYGKYKIPIAVYGTNNNLFNVTDLSYGGWYDGTGAYLTDTTYSVMSDYLPVSSAQYYIQILGTPPFSFELVWLDNNKDFISRYYRTSLSSQEYICNVAKGSAFFRIGLSCRTSQTITEDYVLDSNLYVSTAPTDKTNIYLNEPLRKIGDYVDYINFKNQQHIKNVAVVNFTGEEEWHVQGNAYSTYIPHTPSRTPPTLCNAFSLSTSGSTAVGEYRLDGIDSWNGNVLFNYDNGADGVVNFKSYLAEQYANGTPVKFYYPSVTAITELIEPPKIPTFSGTNVIDVDTTVNPSKIEFEMML